MVGHSNGAMMSYRMAGDRPSLLAAIAPTSGAIGSPAFVIDVPSAPIPLFIVHGLQDSLVPMDNSRVFLPMSDAVTMFLKCNKCSPTVYSEKGSQQYTSTVVGNAALTYYNSPQTCSQNATVVSLLLNAGHFWGDLQQTFLTNKIQGFYDTSIVNSNSLAELTWLMIKEFRRQ